MEKRDLGQGLGLILDWQLVHSIYTERTVNNSLSLNCTLQPGSAASLKDAVEMKVLSPTVSKSSSTGSVKVKASTF